MLTIMSMQTRPLAPGVVIFGGGASGLWLLDLLHRQGQDVLLLEANDLGGGETIMSHGIIHGESTVGMPEVDAAARLALRDMPGRWRRSLAGEDAPDLTHTRMRARNLFYCRGASLRSHLARLGERTGLKRAVTAVDRSTLPPILAEVSGGVVHMNEPVVEPASLIADLAGQHGVRILKIDAGSGLEFSISGGRVNLIRLLNPETGEPVDLQARRVVFASGAGNDALRSRAGLPRNVAKHASRQLVMARGDLPELNVVFADRASPRLIVTSTQDLTGRRVWQIDGRFAAECAEMSADALLEHVALICRKLLAGFEPSTFEWSTYHINRFITVVGRDGEAGIHLLADGNVLTAWPMTLALVPRLADLIIANVGQPHEGSSVSAMDERIVQWPRPAIALPPWESAPRWYHHA